jgi:hypothetical protein
MNGCHWVMADSDCFDLHPSLGLAIFSTYLLFKRAGSVFSELVRYEFQKVLFWQKAMLSHELVSSVSHFLNDRISRNEMVFRESEFAGSFIRVEVDDGDVRSWL